MADHGESLGAHGEDTHGIFLYDETIRVPLLIKLPGASATGTLRRKANRDAGGVGGCDADDATGGGVEVPAVVQGESLLGLMKAQRATGRRTCGATVRHTRSRIIRMRLDGAHCNRCARENICMCRRRGGAV